MVLEIIIWSNSETASEKVCVCVCVCVWRVEYRTRKQDKD